MELCLRAIGKWVCRWHATGSAGGMDTTGAVRAVESITAGLQWRTVRPPVTVTGPPSKPDLEACWELGALLAAEIAG